MIVALGYHWVIGSNVVQFQSNPKDGTDFTSNLQNNIYERHYF